MLYLYYHIELAVPTFWSRKLKLSDIEKFEQVAWTRGRCGFGLGAAVPEPELLATELSCPLALSEAVGLHHVLWRNRVIGGKVDRVEGPDVLLSLPQKPQTECGASVHKG